jgi:hypothetical protein
MGPPSLVRSVVDRNVMRRIIVCACYDRHLVIAVILVCGVVFLYGGGGVRHRNICSIIWLLSAVLD